MEKDHQATDYAAILADMKAKRHNLDTAIASLEAALASGVLGAAPSGGHITAAGAKHLGEPMPLPRGALLGKSANDAIKLYLASVRKKQTNKEISDALKQGGVESTGKSFDAYVNSALFRLKETGELLRFDDGWGLSVWYPESFRTRVAEKTDTGKRKGKKKKPVWKAKTSEPKEVKAKPAKSSQGAGLEQRIEAFLRTDPARVFSDVDIVMKVGGSAKTINLSLGRMAKKGMAVKRQDGFQAPPENLHPMPKAG